MIGENIYKIPVSYQVYFFIIFLSGVYIVYEYLTMYSFHSYLIIFLTINFYYTLIEYIIHRFFFHMNRFEQYFHQKHHDNPKQDYRLFIPIHITLVNEVILGIVSYLFFNDYFLAILSSTHFSYLLFEMVHYCAHHPLTFFSYFIPKRLISFHYMHHIEEDYNYGFTTPFWDILCGTSMSSFNVCYYPFSLVPISVVSFIDLDELVVLSIIAIISSISILLYN